MIRGSWPKLGVEKTDSCRIQVGEIKAKHRGVNIISRARGKKREHSLSAWSSQLHIWPE